MSTRPFSGLRRVFLDTGAYFALAVSQDANYPQALSILERLEQQPSRLFTTNFVVAETHALLLARSGRDLAARVLAEIDRSRTTIVRVRHQDEQRARQIIFQYTDRSFSFTDATSFSIMERLAIDTAFTFDRNFAQYGFQALGVASGA
jgi:predicted nucleic acid-binding protein